MLSMQLLRRNRPHRDEPDGKLAPASTAVSASASASASALASTTPESDPDRPAAGPTLASLPVEIHLLIARQLIYPDALSLKHSSRHFYGLVDTGVRLKVEWLMERRMLHLECPNDRRCDLGSDLRFCRGSVPLLMKRRREHLECESRPNLGCLVHGTKTCSHRGKLSVRWKRWLRAGMKVELWVVLLAVVPVLVGFLCAAIFIS